MNAKYYQLRRYYYEVRADRIIRVINKAYVTEIRIAHTDNMQMSFWISDIDDGIVNGQVFTITREEFAAQLQEAQRLIVLEP